MFHWHGSLVYASINIKHEVPVCFSESAIKYAMEEGVMVCSWQGTSSLYAPQEEAHYLCSICNSTPKACDHSPQKHFPSHEVLIAETTWAASDLNIRLRVGRLIHWNWPLGQSWTARPDCWASPGSSNLAGTVFHSALYLSKVEVWNDLEKLNNESVEENFGISKSSWNAVRPPWLHVK